MYVGHDNIQCMLCCGKNVHSILLDMLVMFLSNTQSILFYCKYELGNVVVKPTAESAQALK